MAVNGSSGWKLFGFKITRDDDVAPVNPRSIRPEDISEKTFSIPQTDDGALNILSGAHSGVFIDFEGATRNEIELISRYREMAMQPEIETALDDIVNESIVLNDQGKSIDIILDDLDISGNIKRAIEEEFNYILKLLGFKHSSHEIFRRWYIDGRLPYHVVINEQNPQEGIKELRYVDPRRLRKVREITKTKDLSGMEIISNIDEYFVYNQMGYVGAYSNMGIRIAKDSIVYITSGLLDPKKAIVLSYLNKAIKPLNQLRMLEDAAVIYRVTRAPERRIFYVDVGTLPKIKAEQYLKSIMTQYRNKIVYNSTTGEITDDRKFLSALEDYWLPRREGQKSTEIDTLPGAQNIDQVMDLEYFQKNLYRSLSVPYSRFESATGFAIGRTTEITRDEVKFAKFIDRLRIKFSKLFYDTLKIQCVLKGICTLDEWEEIAEKIRFNFQKDNNFAELKEAELYQNRINLLMAAQPFVGVYFSKKHVKKNILRFSEDEIEQMMVEIEQEQEEMLNDQEHMAHMAAVQQGVAQLQSGGGGYINTGNNGGSMDNMLDDNFMQDLPPRR